MNAGRDQTHVVGELGLCQRIDPVGLRGDGFPRITAGCTHQNVLDCPGDVLHWKLGVTLVVRR
jgi:hypothetical protein